MGTSNINKNVVSFPFQSLLSPFHTHDIQSLTILKAPLFTSSPFLEIWDLPSLCERHVDLQILLSVSAFPLPFYENSVFPLTVLLVIFHSTIPQDPAFVIDFWDYYPTQNQHLEFFFSWPARLPVQKNVLFTPKWP